MCKADSHQIGLWRSQQQLIHTCQGLCGDRLLKDGHLIGSGKSIVQEMMIVIPILILVNQEPFVCWKESFATKIWISGPNLRSVPVFFFPSSRPCETPSAANCIHRWSARHHPLPRFRRRCCSGDDTNGKQSIPWHCRWGSKPFLLPTKRRLSFLLVSWL